MTRTRWIAGCMTGTSLDGLDVALAEIHGTGLDMKATFRGMVSKPLGDLAGALRHFAEGRAAPPIEYLRAARRLGELHADAVEELCKTYLRHPNDRPQRPPTPVGGSAPKLDFIVAHGQTIWHAPDEHLSFQLFDPWPLVRRLRVPVCYDLRQADLIAGGQGAPISPIADWVLYRSATRHRTIVNLGGICNVTQIPAVAVEPVIEGEDVCPCNLLIDGLVRRLFPGERFDEDGAISQRGTVDSDFYMPDRLAGLLSSVRGDAIRSLGREDITAQFLDQLIAEAPPHLRPDDLVASAVAYVSEEVGMCVPLETPVDLILAGGGVKNRTLIERIKANFHGHDVNVLLTDEIGIPCEAREALAFAVLGALSQDKISISLPRITGSTNPGIAGAWAYP